MIATQSVTAIFGHVRIDARNFDNLMPSWLAVVAVQIRTTAIAVFRHKVDERSHLLGRQQLALMACMARLTATVGVEQL